MKKWIIQLKDGSYLKHRSTLPLYHYPAITESWYARNTTRNLDEARIFNNKSAVKNAMLGGNPTEPKAVEVRVTIEIA